MKFNILKMKYLKPLLIFVSLLLFASSLIAQVSGTGIGESSYTIENRLTRMGLKVERDFSEGVKYIYYGGEGEGGYVVHTYFLDEYNICVYSMHSTTSAVLSKQLKDSYDLLYKKKKSTNECVKSWIDNYGVVVCYKEVMIKGVRHYQVHFYKE